MASEVNYGHKVYALPVPNPFQLLTDPNPIATKVDTPRPKYPHSMTPLRNPLKQVINQAYLTNGAYTPIPETSDSDEKENKGWQKKS